MQADSRNSELVSYLGARRDDKRKPLGIRCILVGRLGLSASHDVSAVLKEAKKGDRIPVGNDCKGRRGREMIPNLKPKLMSMTNGRLAEHAISLSSVRGGFGGSPESLPLPPVCRSGMTQLPMAACILGRGGPHDTVQESPDDIAGF